MAGGDVAEALASLQPTHKDAKALVSVLKDLFKTFEHNYENRLDSMKSDFLSAINERNEAIETLQHDVTRLKKHISKLEERIEYNEAYERRDALVFSGSELPAPSNSENCPQLVGDLLKKHLNISLQPNEISVCHRMPSKPNNNSTPKQSIIVKFCKRSSKADILTSARRKKVVNFYVNECLTPSAQTISYVLRKAKRQFPEKISGSTTYDGKNFVWVKPPNQSARDVRHSVATYDRLVDFCSRVLEKTVTDFIDVWPH